MAHSATQSRSRPAFRAALALTDQAVVSATSFATSLIIGRTCGKEQLGLYGLALAMMLIASEVQTALVSTPHMVNTPRLGGAALRRFHGSTLLHQFGLSLVFTLMLLIGGVAWWMAGKPMLAMTLFALAGGITASSLGVHARTVCFTDHRPGAALIVDFVSCALQLGLLLLLASADKLSAATAILTVCLTTLPPAIGWLIGVLPRMTPTIKDARQDFRWIWPQARFVFASGILWAAGMHLYPWLIDVTASHEAVGVWNACFTVAAIGNPLMLGTMNMLGPAIARQFTMRSLADFRRYVWAMTGGFVGAMLLFAIPLAIFAEPLVSLLYGDAYAGHGAVVGLLAFALVARAAGYTVSRGLFVLQRADLDLLTNAAPIAVLLMLGIVLTSRNGVEGAAWSLLIAQLLGTIVRCGFFAYTARAAGNTPRGNESEVAQLPTAEVTAQ